MVDYKEEQIRVREELALTVEELQRELKLRSEYPATPGLHSDYVMYMYMGFSL